MNSALMMTERKNPSLNGASNGKGSQGAMINALRKLYDPVLEEPIPDFLLRAASMTREEAQANLPTNDGSDAASSPSGEQKAVS